jgi:hypothetical protein
VGEARAGQFLLLLFMGGTVLSFGRKAVANRCERFVDVRNGGHRMTALDGQFALLIDTINDAIRDTCRAIGRRRSRRRCGPTKKPEAAERYLDDCLNPSREQKLSIDEILVIARMGREKGIHLIATYINRDVGYTDPTPVDPGGREGRAAAPVQ